MKHLIGLILIATISLNAFAQSTRSYTLKAYNHLGVYTSLDTLKNTDTVYLWDGTKTCDQWDKTHLQYSCTQLTGTTTCTMLVQGSDNATSGITSGKWYTLSNCTECQTKGLVDTGTVKNTTYDFLINSDGAVWKYLRVMIFTSGTQTSIPAGTEWLSAKYKAGTP